MSLKHLASKLLAGGLTAGIVLIWWPQHYPTDGLQWLVLRGIVGTLGFELLLLAYAPIEDRITRRLAQRTPVDRLRARVGAVPTHARTGGTLFLGAAAVALPAALLASAGAPPVPQAHARPLKQKVIREVIVKRKVVHDRIVVHDTVPPGPAAGVPPRPSTAAPPQPATAPAPSATQTQTRRSAARTPSSTSPTEGTKAPATSQEAAPAKTKPAEPKPAAPTTTSPPAADPNAATAVTETTPGG